MIPYGRQQIDEDDIAAVTEVLRGDFLTTGPKVAEFEKALCDYTGAKHALANSNGTTALHMAALAAGIGEGDQRPDAGGGWCGVQHHDGLPHGARDGEGRRRGVAGDAALLH